MFVLVIARFKQAAAKRQHQSNGMFCHRPRIDARCAGQSDTTLLEQGSGELVGARADRLDKPQVRCMVEKVVFPQAGDNQHIGFSQPCL